jgi:HSP20 family molecular chaperone IbpA
MTAMRLVGNGHKVPPHARVQEDPGEYLIELDVSDFTESELTIDVLGPLVTVRGDQLETKEDEGLAFRLRERLEESFRLPDDVAIDRIKAFYEHGTLELHAPRRPLRPHTVAIEHKFSLVNPDAAAC